MSEIFVWLLIPLEIAVWVLFFWLWLSRRKLIDRYQELLSETKESDEG